MIEIKNNLINIYLFLRIILEGKTVQCFSQLINCIKFFGLSEKTIINNLIVKFQF
jgi:hypothetical protein